MIDDLASTDPWTPRGLEVRGTAELHDTGGPEKFGEGWGKASETVPKFITKADLNPVKVGPKLRA